MFSRITKEEKEIKAFQGRLLNISYFISFLCYRPYSENDLQGQDKKQKEQLFKKRHIFVRKNGRAFNYFTDYEFVGKLFVFFSDVSSKELLYDLPNALNLFVNEYPWHFTEKETKKLKIVFGFLTDGLSIQEYEILIQGILRANKNNLVKTSVDFYSDYFSIDNKKSKRKKFLIKTAILSVSIIIFFVFI